MDRFIDFSRWSSAAADSAMALGDRLAAVLPLVLAAGFIVGVGWVVSRTLQSVALHTLRRAHFDRVLARMRLDKVLEQAGIDASPSQAVARALFWFVMFVTFLTAVRTLGLASVNAMVTRLVDFVPDLLAAAVVLFVGLPVARFAGALTRSAAAATGVAGAARFGTGVRVFVAGLVAVVAMEQLGVDTNILVVPLTVGLGVAGLSVGFALALGASRIITHILAGHYLKQSLPRDSVVEVEGEQGIVERIGATDTLFRNGDRTWSVPNARLLESNIRR